MKQITYLKECLKNNTTIIRWPDNCMPLAVYIAPFRWYKAQNEGYKYKQMVIDALNLWQKASEDKITFTIVNTMNESQINIDWKRVDRISLGHCYFNHDSLGRLYSAEVQIGLSDGIIHSQYQNENEVNHTIIHEIGHALGLGHSPYKDDIMYVPHQYGIVNVSNRDKDTMKWLYKFNCGSSVGEIASSLGFIGITDIDELVLKLLSKNYKSPFEELKSTIQVQKDENLVKEQDILADINRFNLSVQNVKISSSLEDYVKKVMIEKHLK